MHITHTLGISENFDFEGFHNIPSPFHIKYNTTPSSQTFAKAFWRLIWNHQANQITVSSGISDREKLRTVDTFWWRHIQTHTHMNTLTKHPSTYLNIYFSKTAQFQTKMFLYIWMRNEHWLILDNWIGNSYLLVELLLQKSSFGHTHTQSTPALTQCI